MSADRWSECPACQRDVDRAERQRKEHVRSAYGQVPIEEFDRLRAEAEKPLDRPETLREDYEIFIEGAGVRVIYSAHCSKCDLLIKLDDHHQFERLNFNG